MDSRPMGGERVRGGWCGMWDHCRLARRADHHPQRRCGWLARAAGRGSGARWLVLADPGGPQEESGSGAPSPRRVVPVEPPGSGLNLSEPSPLDGAVVGRRRPGRWRGPRRAALLLASPVPRRRPGLNWILQDQAPMGNAERLRLGLDQYRRAQYEEAVADASARGPRPAAPGDRQIAQRDAAPAETASDERRIARAEFERGEEALNAGQLPRGDRLTTATPPTTATPTRAPAPRRASRWPSPKRRRAARDRACATIYNQAVADYKARDLDVGARQVPADRSRPGSGADVPAESPRITCVTSSVGSASTPAAAPRADRRRPPEQPRTEPPPSGRQPAPTAQRAAGAAARPGADAAARGDARPDAAARAAAGARRASRSRRGSTPDPQPQPEPAPDRRCSRRSPRAPRCRLTRRPRRR